VFRDALWMDVLMGATGDFNLIVNEDEIGLVGQAGQPGLSSSCVPGDIRSRWIRWRLNKRVGCGENAISGIGVIRVEFLLI
jgi:hypothetical protein